MNNLIPKLRNVYLPFLIIAFSIIVGYTFLHWLLIIRLEIIELDEAWVEFGIPFGVAFAVCFIWLRPQIKSLGLIGKKNKGKDPFSFYAIIAALAIAAPTIIAQGYIKTATGKLSKLSTVEQIAELPHTKYYTFKKFYVNKQQIGVARYNEASGKHNEYLNFNIYIACPILKEIPKHSPFDLVVVDSVVMGDEPLVLINGKFYSKEILPKIDPNTIQNVSVLKPKQAEPIYGQAGWNGVIVVQTSWLPPPVAAPSAWLGIKYHLQISNRLSDAAKEAQYKEFNDDSFRKFAIDGNERFEYLDRINYSDDLKEWREAANNAGLIQNSNEPIILKPVYQPFAQRNGEKLPWIFYSFGIGAGIFLIMVLIPGFVERKPVSKQRQQLLTKKQWRDNLTFFIPKPGFYVTAILIDVNILVFAAMVFAGLGFISFNGADLLAWGANYGPYTANGQWWRLLTNIFMHGGFFHIANNLVSLMFVGVVLEPLLGTKKYLIIYLVTGIIASFTSMLWHSVASVGASGAIFGLFGVFAALLTTKTFQPPARKAFGTTVAIFIGFNLLLGLSGGIDNAAHIGGLVSGIIAGYIVYFTMPPAEEAVDEDNEPQN